MMVLSHSGGKGRHGTGRTKDVPGFDRLTGSLAFTADLSGSARELVTRELSGPEPARIPHEQWARKDQSCVPPAAGYTFLTHQMLRIDGGEPLT
jgi:hypothetical protein